MDEELEIDACRTPPSMFNKCGRQCYSACNDRNCCSPRYYSPISTCTVHNSRPCACLQNIKLEYNVEQWPENWREEFFNLRKMWSNHSKFSCYNLADKNSSNGTVTSKYCNRDFCWHERPYRTNSVSIKCACCTSRNMRNHDPLSERISQENIPRLYDIDFLKHNAQISSEKCVCSNGNSGLPKDYMTSRTPEKYIRYESRPVINPCYSKSRGRQYSDSIESKIFCCPCCKYPKRLPELPKFDIEEYPVKEPKRIQRCYKGPNERPQTSKRASSEQIPVREQPKIQRCYRKPTVCIYEDNRPTKDVPLQRNKFNDDFENDGPLVHMNRHIKVPNMSHARNQNYPKKNFNNKRYFIVLPIIRLLVNMFKKVLEYLPGRTIVTAIHWQYGPPIHFQFRSRCTNASTVDNIEMSHFKMFASSWWDELGTMKGLHSMNVLRVPFIRDGLKHNGKLDADCVSTSKPLRNIHILDVGCGGGILSEPLAKLGANVTGLDACEELIECAKVHANYDSEIKGSLQYVHGSLEVFCTENKDRFDAVVASEILEHVDSQDLFLKSCIEVLKPGGSLFITTMNKTSLAWIGGILGAEYIFNFVPKGTHDWDKFVAPHEVQKMLEIKGCQTRKMASSSGVISSIDNKDKFARSTSAWWTLPTLTKFEGLNEVKIPAMIKVLVETDRISRETALTEKPLIGLRILDIGCNGEGFLTETLAKLGAEITAIDPSARLIENAKRHIKYQETIVNNIEYICTTVEDYCENNSDKFDHVTCAEVLEHIVDKATFIKCCIRTLKPNGTILLSTINRTMKAWYTTILMHEYVYRIATRGKHLYNKFLTPNELQLMLEENNYRCNIIYINMSSTNTTVLAQEMNMFNDLSTNWWTLSVLESQNEIRIPEIIKGLVETGRISRKTAESNKPLAGLKILDAGCGGGFLSEPLAKLGAQVTGVDPCLKLIECARQHIENKNDIKEHVEYIHSTLEEFCENNLNKYDHVVAAEVLDHIQARDLFIKSCVKTLKCNQLVIMSPQPKITTIDKKELDHFNSFVDNWTGNLPLLERMNVIRIPFIQEGLVNAGKLSAAVAGNLKPLSGMKILDVGCGVGVLSVPLVKAGAIVTGLDAAAEVIQCAKQHAKTNEIFKDNLNYVCDSIENFSATNAETFDAVVASEIIEHVASADLFVKSCLKTLKPGGSIFITTINKTIWSWLKAIIFLEYIKGCIPRGTHEWNKFISPKELGAILEHYNCKVKLVAGWHYEAFAEKWTNTNDLSVFYLLHAVKAE
ncbi:Coenzyme Q3 [Carabus blaptoides fortunei]